MKKILIIFFGLILGCNLASAKSVSCWDEYTQAYLPGTESKMKTVLGNDVNIIKVATKAKAFTYYGSTPYNIELYLPKDVNSYKSVNSSSTYYPAFQSLASFSVSYGFTDYSTRTSVAYYQSGATTPSISYSGDSSTRLYYQDYNNQYYALGLYFGTFIHTYCIVDEGSSGGGGGGATGSVNFIIKATS